MDAMTAPRQPEESLNPSPNRPPRRLTPAQRSNLLQITAVGYMSWRTHSLSLLTGTAFPLQRETQLFLAQCNPQPGQRWLDIGTSGGYYAGVLAGEGASVLACDLSAAMLRVAAAREPSPLIDFALFNAEDSWLPAASFDGITIGATLNETASAPAMLRESARLLRPGGQLWMMYLARNAGPSQTLLSRLGGLSFPDPAQLSSWLPGMERSALFRVGEVVFERWIKTFA